MDLLFFQTRREAWYTDGGNNHFLFDQANFLLDIYDIFDVNGADNNTVLEMQTSRRHYIAT
jgi:hypothetical protein